MDNIEMLINEIESELLKAKKSAFSSTQVLVDKHLMLDLVSRLRSALPPVIRDAARVMRDHDGIIAQANDYAKKTLENAQAEAAKLISESEIVLRAREDAERMLSEADENYRKMDYDARFLAYKILDENEKMLKDFIAQIAENKKKLAE
jgi:vacuolar-type H+-ATPase subunit H